MPCLQTRVDNLERSVGINGEGVTTVLGLGRDPFNYGLISRNCKNDNQSCQKKKKRPNGGFLVERQSKRGSESIPIPETDGKCEFFWFPNRPRCLGVSEASYII